MSNALKYKFLLIVVVVAMLATWWIGSNSNEVESPEILAESLLADLPAVDGLNPFTDHEETRTANDEEPFSALVFKVMTDPYVGKLTFFRVYSGVLEAGSGVLNATKGKKERIGRILQMHANKRDELDMVHAGDIAAGERFLGALEPFVWRRHLDYWAIQDAHEGRQTNFFEHIQIVIAGGAIGADANREVIFQHVFYGCDATGEL